MKKALLALILSTALLTGLAGCSKPASQAAASSAGSSQPQAAESTNTNSDWAYIQNKGSLTIGITYFEPMNFLTADGTLTGFETEFATAVCKILGVTPEFQEINWNSKETELNAKNIDCIWNGMTIDADRAANMSISQPYMQNKQVLVVKNENVQAMSASVDGLTLVAEAGSAGETVATTEDFFAKATFIPVDTQAKALMEVAAGTADACVIDYVMSIGMIGEGTDYAGLTAVEERGFGQEQYGIGMRKADTELTAKINDAINQLIQSGELQAIAEKYKLAELLILE